MELSIIIWIQSFNNPFLDIFFQYITAFGEETFIILFFSILYWSVNKDLAKFVGYSFFVSLLFNTGLKEFFHLPRPIGIEGIRSLRIQTATGFSFPSGHTQAVASLFSSLSIYLKKTSVTIISIIIIFSVALSRLYLGVHWPRDVVGAIIISLIITFIAYKTYKNNKTNMVLLILALSAIIPILIFKNPEFAKSYGLLIGFNLGIMCENKYINFETTKNIGKNISRIAIGLIGIILLKEGIKLILPIHYIFDLLRYFMISFYGIGVVPMIIKKFNL